MIQQDSSILLSPSATSISPIHSRPSSPLQRKWSLKRQTQKLSGVNFISRTMAAANGSGKGKDAQEVDEGLWDNNDQQFQADLRDEDKSSLPNSTFLSSSSARDSRTSFSSYEEVISTRERLSFLGTSLPIKEESLSETHPQPFYSSSLNSKVKRPDTGGSASFSHHPSRRSSTNWNSVGRPLSSSSSSLFSNSGYQSGGGATLSSPSEASSAISSYPSPISGSSRIDSDKEYAAVQEREKEKEAIPIRPSGGIRRSASASVHPKTRASSDLPLLLSPHKTPSNPQSPVLSPLQDQSNPILLASNLSSESSQQHLGLNHMQRAPRPVRSKNSIESEKAPGSASFDISFPSPDAAIFSLDAVDPTPRMEEPLNAGSAFAEALNLKGTPSRLDGKRLGQSEGSEGALFQPLDEESLRLSLPQPDSTLQLSHSFSSSSLHRLEKKSDPIHNSARRPSLPIVSSPYTTRSNLISISTSDTSKSSKLKKSSSSKSIGNLRSTGGYSKSSKSSSISDLHKASSEEEGLVSYSKFSSGVGPETIEEEKAEKLSSPRRGKAGGGFKAGLMKLVNGPAGAGANSSKSGISSSTSVPTNLHHAGKASRNRSSTANVVEASTRAKSTAASQRTKVTEDIQVIGEYDATYGIPTFSNFGASAASGDRSPLTEGPSFEAYAIPIKQSILRDQSHHHQSSRFLSNSQSATSKEIVKGATGTDGPRQFPLRQNGSKRDSKTHQSQTNQNGRTRTTSMESLNGILRRFGPRPSSSGTGNGFDSNRSRRQSIIEHTSFDEARRNSSNTGAAIISGEQLELLRSVKPGSRPASAHSSFAAMEGGGLALNGDRLPSSPNALSSTFNAAHSRRWSRASTSGIDFFPSQEKPRSNSHSLSGSFSARAPTIDRFQANGNESCKSPAHLDGRRSSFGASTSNHASSSSKRWSSLWNSIPGTSPAPSPKINISRPLSSSSSLMCQPEGFLSCSAPQDQDAQRLKAASPKLERVIQVDDHLVSPKTQVFGARPATSDAIYGKGFSIPDSSISLAAATGLTTQSRSVQKTRSHLPARPITADQIPNNRSKRRPSFGLNISPAAADAFDSIPSPRSRHVTGLGLSVRSTVGNVGESSDRIGIAGGKVRGPTSSPQIVESNSAFASPVNQTQSSDADNVEHHHHAHGSFVSADAPVTPSASEEEKELLDLELLEDPSHLTDGAAPIEIEIGANSPLMTSESADRKSSQLQDHLSYGFV